jgi:hypothetical protein
MLASAIVRSPLVDDQKLVTREWFLYLDSLDKKALVTYGTRSSRTANRPADFESSLWVETDTGLIYQSRGVVTVSGKTVSWTYAGGAYQRTQAQLAALAAAIAAALTTNDVGLLVEVTDFRHILRWTGTAWSWGPGEDGRHDIAACPVDPDPTTGWALCDGSATTYLKSDGTTGNYTTPDLIGAGAGAYLKLGDTVAGPTAASAPALSMDSYTPAGSVAAIAATTAGAISAGTGGVFASVSSHGHPAPAFTGTPATLTGSVSSDGEPRNLVLRPWFRR